MNTFVPATFHPPSRRLIRCLSCSLAVILIGCLGLAGVRGEETDASEKSDLVTEEDIEAMREVGAEHQKAAIRQSFEAPGGTIHGKGVFLSEDGLALFNSGSFASETKPRFYTAEGKELEFGKILGVFLDYELVLMKFDHQPEAWVPLASSEPERGDLVSVVVLEEKDRLVESELPPMVARMLTTTTDTIVNYRVGHFSRLLNLGCHPTSEQAERMRPGTFAVNREGELVGFQFGSRGAYQRIFYLTSTDGLSELVAKATEEDASLPFPLPAELNLTDRASFDPENSQMDLAIRKGDRSAAAEHRKNLAARYPESRMVRIVTGRAAETVEEALADFPVPADSDPLQKRIMARLDRSMILAARNDLARAIPELEAAIKICPKDFTHAHLKLATMQMNTGNVAGAEEVFRQISEVEPDNLDLLELLGTAQYQQDKFSNFLATDARVDELTEWYPRN